MTQRPGSGAAPSPVAAPSTSLPVPSLRASEGEGASHPAAGPWVAVMMLALTGGVASWVLSRPAPAAPGAARIASAPVLLASFDVLWFLALAWPRACTARHRGLAAAVLLAVGLPFHAALAAAAGASGGHAGACAAIAAAAVIAGGLAGGRRLFAPLLAVTLFAVPLAAYALTDLAPITGDDGQSVSALSWGSASPLLAAVLLAFRAPDAVAADGVPAVVALLAVATLALLVRRQPRAALAIVLLGGIATSAAAAPSNVEPLLGGHVREGRPIVVRAPGARRVRIDGGPWSGPLGARGDEFVLLGVPPRGTTLTLDVDRSGRVSGGGATGAELERVEVSVRPLSLAGEWTAALDGRGAADGVVAVSPVDLPTVAEAWLVFDAVVGVPDGLAPAERLALQARLQRADSVVPEPTLLTPSPLPFRAAAQAAAAAPGLASGAARPLLVLAGLLALLAMVMRLRPGDLRTAAWTGGVSILAAAWLLIGDALPGAIHAHAIVLAGDTDGSELVLLRLAAIHDGEVTVDVNGDSTVLVPLRWGNDDEPPDGQSVGARATLRIQRGRSVLLAARTVASRAPDAARDTAIGDPLNPGHPLAEWARKLGLAIFETDAGDAASAIRLDGARLTRVGRFALSRSK